MSNAMSRVTALETMIALESTFPGISEQAHWLNQGLEISESFVAHPQKIIGRCNDLTRGKYWSKSSQTYLDYKTWLKAELAIPEILMEVADGILIDFKFALPKSCLKKDGTPTAEGLRRLSGEVKGLPIDCDNGGKPVMDAATKTDDGQIKDADIMIFQVTKCWGLENKVTVRLLMPIFNNSKD